MTATPPALLALALDLRVGPPRSPREPLADYALAARCVDKCRASLLGQAGDYHYACPMDRRFLDFAGLDPDAFRAFVATGADDAAIAEHLRQHATPRTRGEVVAWSHRLRDMRISELDEEMQLKVEDWIAEDLPPGARPFIKVWFDVIDLEEGRLPLPAELGRSLGVG